MKILPSENVISGAWVFSDGRLVADAECIRIEQLVNSFLRLLGRDASGWEAIYRDPEDGRFWELTYPQSELYGGGAPRLACLSKDEALQKYGSTVVSAEFKS